MKELLEYREKLIRLREAAQELVRSFYEIS